MCVLVGFIRSCMEVCLHGSPAHFTRLSGEALPARGVGWVQYRGCGDYGECWPWHLFNPPTSQPPASAATSKMRTPSAQQHFIETYFKVLSWVCLALVVFFVFFFFTMPGRGLTLLVGCLPASTGRERLAGGAVRADDPDGLPLLARGRRAREPVRGGGSALSRLGRGHDAPLCLCALRSGPRPLPTRQGALQGFCFLCVPSFWGARDL